MRARFWENVPLSEMTAEEWEALCDGCGKCCLIKLEEEDTGDVYYTSVACRLLDDSTCRCGNYAIRKQLVPDCIVLSLKTLPDIAYWLPPTCAYKRLYDGETLPEWHPLVTGDPNSTHDAGISVKNRTTPEYEVAEEDLEDYLLRQDR
ncbi:YcgN family cysteine cluster protein [Paracoccaceae bacterium GXU_MW_L88]